MCIWKFTQSLFSKRRLFVVLSALLLVSGLVSSQAPNSALGMRFNPPDDGGDQIQLPPPQFHPPANGFTWSVPPRYGLNETPDGLMDTYWNASTFSYDPAYIYPDHWSMQFNGCQTAEDAESGASTTNTYTWSLDGRTFTGPKCNFIYNEPGFSAQGTYPVTLTVAYGDGTTASFQQDVYIKDYLIVAMGDSLASGEGNPDIRQQVVPVDPFGNWIPGNPAVWQDKRCHRTAFAYPSQAAIALEFGDPHTSVTFISFACSGATIFTPQWEMKAFNWVPPFFSPDPDPEKNTGSGILGRWRGNDMWPWDSYDPATFIPPQIDQLQAALNPPAGKNARQFDALIVSAGGNDFHFGDIASACLFDDHCWPDAMIWENPTVQYNMEQLVNRALTPYANGGSYYSLPNAYAELASHINALNPKPAKVYITQYADQTRADTYGNYCRMLDDIFTPLTYAVTPREAQLLTENALHGMNHAIQTAAKDYGWQYVDGITSYEVDPDPSKPAGSPGMFVLGPDGKGHGYCASDNWIVRADESEKIQGPGPFRRFLTKGTLHPNGKGIRVLMDRLLYYLRPNLIAATPNNPPGEPPTFSTSLTSGGLTSVAGGNGWYTHSCDNNNNCSPQVVLQVTATGSTPLRGANVYLNDQDNCSVAGVSCPTTVITPTNQVKWDFTFTTEGTYQMQFSARDTNNQVANYVSEIKVDLHDPVFNPLPGPFDVDEGSNITLTAQARDTMSAILNYDWDLDNDGSYEITDEQPLFSAAGLDGPGTRTVGILVTDEASRTATTTSSINVLNVAPTVEILDVPTSSSEGTAINLNSSVTDPGVKDTFTYAWTIKKNGRSFASGTSEKISFTPDDNGAYDVSLNVTDDDGGVGTASQTITVDNLAPVLSNVTATPGTVDEGGDVTLSGDISDPGSADTFTLTIDWGDGSLAETASLASGTKTFSLTHTYADDNPTGTPSDAYSIGVSLADDDGGEGTGSASIVVNNLAPSLSISTPVDGALYAVNASVSLSGIFSDKGTEDTFSCSVNWGDGATTAGTLTSGGCAASHAYSAAGVYTIQMTLTDDDTGSDTKPVMVVVYDPSAGFVTGGGWITSPTGAYKPDESLSGKATFGFVSRYQKGATVPTGNTAFEFQTGGFEFYSTAYEWLVVNQAGTNAQFKGTGMVNGTLDPNGNAYKFMLWASDGSPDTFRIQIWWEDAAGEHYVYDNGLDQTLGGGNIVVHISK